MVKHKCTDEDNIKTVFKYNTCLNCYTKINDIPYWVNTTSNQKACIICNDCNSKYEVDRKNLVNIETKNYTKL